MGGQAQPLGRSPWGCQVLQGGGLRKGSCTGGWPDAPRASLSGGMPTSGGAVTWESAAAAECHARCQTFAKLGMQSLGEV